MANEGDYASDTETLFRDIAVAAATRGRPPRVRQELCIECGEHIPEARHKALGGTDVCVDCAE